jgi:signal transducing adaptor molecule
MIPTPTGGKGSNHRGEGLFPANFVTKNLDAEPEDALKDDKRRRSVQFNDEVEVKTVENSDLPQGPVEIDGEKIQRVLDMLNDADPANGDSDPPDMTALEEQANMMGPLIDAELEGVDRRLAQLTRLSTELVDALNLYHQLMRELPAGPAVMPGMPGMYNMGYNPSMPYQQPQIVPPEHMSHQVRNLFIDD